MLKLNAAHIEGLQVTKRWHTRDLPPQTLADHSCAVALLAALIGGDTVSQEQLGQLFGLALVYDLHETRFGNLPYPAKRYLREKGMDLDEHFRMEFWGPAPGADPYDAAPLHLRHLVDVADILDAALYARRHGSAELAETCRVQASKAIHDQLTGGCAARALQVLGETGPLSLSICPGCGGPADNGHDRCIPPSPYLCTKCQEKR